jgi:hypothetical protein
MVIKFLKAYNGDSILISFQDDTGINRNILIDGGTPATYCTPVKKGDLYFTIQNIKRRSESIDLLILTHIDGDHIGGLKKWFEKDKDAFDLIKKVWFNSGKTIAKHFEMDENEELIETLNIFESNLTSVPQAIVFEDYIERFNVWDKEIIKEGRVACENGVKIELLSPNDELLKRLLTEYKKPKYNYATNASECDWKTSIDDFIKEESNDNFKGGTDNSLENGSSIAFILTIKEKRFLFLGDAYPSIVIDSLIQLNFSKTNPLAVEFMKVSHHGSSNNTNKELLELIKTDNYIISTNSDMHNLPDKRTLARIIDYNPNAVFYFNYDNVKKIFLDEDLKKYRNFDFKIITEWI